MLGEESVVVDFTMPPQPPLLITTRLKDFSAKSYRRFGHRCHEISGRCWLLGGGVKMFVARQVHNGDILEYERGLGWLHRGNKRAGTVPEECGRGGQRTWTGLVPQSKH